MQNYYATLGLSVTASSTEIKSAYRRLAMQYHPDKHGGNVLYEEKFKKIVRAYTVLSDLEKREKYDQRLAYSTRQYQPSSPISGNKSNKYYQKKKGQDAKQRKAQEKKALWYGILFLLVMGIAGSGLFFAMNAYSAKKYFEEGLSFEKDALYNKAVGKYLLVLEVNPKHAGALEKLGDLKIKFFQDYETGIRLYNASIHYSEKPNSYLFYKKGKAFLALKKADSAEVALATVVEINPLNDSAWAFLGEIASLRGNYQDALKAYRKASMLSPGFFEAKYGESVALYNLQQYKQTIEIVDTLIHKVPNDPMLYMLRGKSKAFLADSSAACADFLKAYLFGVDAGRVLANKMCKNDFR